MKPPPFSHKHQGEQAELRFVLKAMQEGFEVYFPWGDSSPCDFVLSRSGVLHRIQVKSTSTLDSKGRYRIHAAYGGRKKPYSARQIDAVIACVVPNDARPHVAWYVLPVRVTARHPFIHLRPHRPGSKGRWEKFRDAWHLL